MCCLIWHGKRRCFFARCRTGTGWRKLDPSVLRIFSFPSFLSLFFSPLTAKGEIRCDRWDCSTPRLRLGGCRRRRLSICCSPLPRKTVTSLSVSFLSSAKGEISHDRWFCWTIRRRLRRWLSSRKGHGDLPICLFPLLGGIVASSISGESKVKIC